MLIEMILKPFGWMLPGGELTMFALTTIVMIIAGGPFIKTATAAFKKTSFKHGHPSCHWHINGLHL